jgi:hypothetical protein
VWFRQASSVKVSNAFASSTAVMVGGSHSLNRNRIATTPPGDGFAPLGAHRIERSRFIFGGASAETGANSSATVQLRQPFKCNIRIFSGTDVRARALPATFLRTRIFPKAAAACANAFCAFTGPATHPKAEACWTAVVNTATVTVDRSVNPSHKARGNAHGRNDE